MKLAICGKGGSGKSTIAALMAQAFIQNGLNVILIDADESNTGLHRLLGFEQAPVTLVEMMGGRETVRQRMPLKDGEKDHSANAGIFPDTPIETNSLPPETVLQNGKLNLISIGKIGHSGEGCACPFGLLGREFLRKLATPDGTIVLVDMEAGIEHFGRGIETEIDGILIVVDPSFESILLAERMMQFAREMELQTIHAVLNKADFSQISEKVHNALHERQIPLLGAIPFDEALLIAGIDGDIPYTTPAGLAVRGITRKMNCVR